MTAATPIITPSMVSSVRILFARRLSIAVRKLSRMLIVHLRPVRRQVPPCPPRGELPNRGPNGRPNGEPGPSSCRLKMRPVTTTSPGWRPSTISVFVLPCNPTFTSRRWGCCCPFTTTSTNAPCGVSLTASLGTATTSFLRATRNSQVAFMPGLRRGSGFSISTRTLITVTFCSSTACGSMRLTLP
jgi:hypothetical protein